MSEYWKSTPKYWCKHCSTYVRDTKLERANHESTAKHQGAVKRSLRDLHRGADQKERDKERARREVERLNGVVSGTSGSASGGTSSSATATTSRTGSRPSRGAYGAPPQQASQADRQKQLEQLADLGVSIPTELRGNMAMAGEWTVTTTRVIESGADTPSAEARATGVKRERERTEEEKEQDEAIKGLFKRPRKWGIDSKTMPADEDAELEALLSGPLVTAKKEEDAETAPVKPDEVKTEDTAQDIPQDDAPQPPKHEPLPPVVKTEPGEEEQLGHDVGAPHESGPGEGGGTPGPAVVFKKRKPKTTRQK